jgi:hypothetical protein
LFDLGEKPLKTKLILACAAAGVAVSAFGSTPAIADEAPMGTISFLPGAAGPGETVQIGGRCNDPKFTTARVTSPILDAPDIYGRDTGAGYPELISVAKVKNNTKPGKYKVSYKCGPDLVSGDLWVTGNPGVVVTPAKAKPGETVTVRLNCPKQAPVTSAALVVDRLAPGEGRPDQPHFIGAGKVKKVKPGVYRVSTTCNGKTLSTSLTVLGASNVQVPVKPKGAPETGAE